MAILAVARNGIGLGHISRMVALCDGLARTGLRPYLYAEGVGASLISRVVPTVLIGEPGQRQSYRIRDLEKQLNRAGLLSKPSCVIEDTLPIGVHLDPSIRHFLVVRPTVFPALEALAHSSTHRYDRVLVADRPDSPTWPYSRLETSLIASWDNWRIVGPLCRVPTKSEIAEVRHRYGWSPRSRFCIFSLGGGGEHAGADDAALFLSQATEVALRILRVDKKGRMIFVRGPLMVTKQQIPGVFHVVENEPLMPALFAAADLACIRPGFNSTWECIVGRTPIVPILGTSYQEPIPERLVRLRQAGLVAEDIENVWLEGKRGPGNSRATYDDRAIWVSDAVMSIRNDLLSEGSYNSSVGIAALRGGANRATRPRKQPEALVDSSHGSSLKRHFFVRVDDVTSLDEEVPQILAILQQRRIHCSMEVIPYLCEFDASSLDRAHYGCADVSIGQHGYCHVSRQWLETGEFDPNDPNDRDLRDLINGKEALEQRFGSYFDKGFAAPFDALPAWLGGAWEQLGGRFISIIRNMPRSGRIPFVTASVDPWNWRLDRRRSSKAISHEARTSFSRLGYAGFVLHPRHFQEKSALRGLERLLDELLRSGATPVPMHALAKFQAAQAITTPSRHYAALRISPGNP